MVRPEQRAPSAGTDTLPAPVLFFAIPVAAAVVGLAIAVVAAPGSEAALVVCGATFPLAYLLCFGAWRSLLGVWLSAIIGQSLIRSSGDEQRFRDEAVRAFTSIREAGLGRLPFTWVFIPVSAAVGLAAAALLVLLSSGRDALAALLLALGATAFGILLRRLARAGRLPLPDE